MRVSFIGGSSNDVESACNDKQVSRFDASFDRSYFAAPSAFFLTKSIGLSATPSRLESFLER